MQFLWAIPAKAHQSDVNWGSRAPIMISMLTTSMTAFCTRVVRCCRCWMRMTPSWSRLCRREQPSRKPETFRRLPESPRSDLDLCTKTQVTCMHVPTLLPFHLPITPICVKLRWQPRMCPALSGTQTELQTITTSHMHLRVHMVEIGHKALRFLYLSDLLLSAVPWLVG